MARNYTVPKLIYAPARRGLSSMLIMLAGTWGSGKTKSALELAVGLADGGTICVADTEHGRALAYADNYKFDHIDLKEPFRPELFEEAANVAQQRGARVWICDNFTWEHTGPGGLLDWHKAELDRLAGNDFAKRDRVKMTAWIEPKAAHTQMLHRFWQLNCHVILCVQAKKKIDMQRDPQTGKMKPVDMGWVPNCGDDIPYAMTTALMLWPAPARPGVPTIIKPNEFVDPLIPLDRQLSDETGRALLAYSRGETVTPVSTIVSTPASTELRGEARNRAVADALIARYRAVKTRAEHMAIVDDELVRKQIEWMQRARPTLFEEVNAALSESWDRTEPPPASDTTPASEPATGPATPPPDDEPPFETGQSYLDQLALEGTL